MNCQLLGQHPVTETALADLLFIYGVCRYVTSPCCLAPYQGCITGEQRSRPAPDGVLTSVQPLRRPVGGCINLTSQTILALVRSQCPSLLQQRHQLPLLVQCHHPWAIITPTHIVSRDEDVWDTGAVSHLHEATNTWEDDQQ